MILPTEFHNCYSLHCSYYAWYIFSCTFNEFVITKQYFLLWCYFDHLKSHLFIQQVNHSLILTNDFYKMMCLEVSANSGWYEENSNNAWLALFEQLQRNLKRLQSSISLKEIKRSHLRAQFAVR